VLGVPRSRALRENLVPQKRAAFEGVLMQLRRTKQ
jgi:hypothetical protein